VSITLEIFKEIFESLIFCTFRENVKGISVEDLFALLLVPPIYICWPFISRERESTVFHISYFVIPSSQFSVFSWNHHEFAVTNTKRSSNIRVCARKKRRCEYISKFLIVAVVSRWWTVQLCLVWGVVFCFFYSGILFTAGN